MAFHTSLLRPALAGVLAVLFLATPPARAELVTFGSRGAFNAANPGLPLEDFEEARVPVGGFGLMAGPLDRFTSNAFFSPGDVLDGLRLSVGSSPFGAENMFISGPGFATYVSRAVSYNFADTTMPQITVAFYGNDVTAFGFDLTSNPNGNPVTVSMFSGATLLGTFTVPNVQGAGTFFGASSSDVITHVTLSGPQNYFGVDNIAFGQAVPEPASLVLASVGALGLLAVQWRRRQSGKAPAPAE